jgi:hypothetical protein
VRIPRTGFVLALALACAAAGSAGAEDLDVGKLIDEGKAAAAEKHYAKSLQSLSLAVTEISRLRLDSLKGLFPAGKDGWEAGEIEAQANSFGAMLGAGFATMKRTYTKGESSYDAELVIDAPTIVGPMQMMLGMAASQPGMQVVTVQGRKALLRLEKENKSGELQILLNAGNAMLTIRGRGVEKADLVDRFTGGFSLEVIEKAIVD